MILKVKKLQRFTIARIQNMIYKKIAILICCTKETLKIITPYHRRHLGQRPPQAASESRRQQPPTTREEEIFGQRGWSIFGYHFDSALNKAAKRPYSGVLSTISPNIIAHMTVGSAICGPPPRAVRGPDGNAPLGDTAR
jgi:hypothetical protein